jgi:hypothetical protein
MRSGLAAGLTLFVALSGCSSDKTPVENDVDPIDARDGGRRPDGGRDAGNNRDSGRSPGKDGGSGGGGGGMQEPDGTIEPVTIDDCTPGELTAAQIDALKAGGDPGDARFTYPYDGTVFPRGIQGPLVAWDKTDPSDAVYVHIKATAFEYHGCLKPTGANELQLPDEVWDTAGSKTYGKRDPFTVELTVASGGKVSGPFAQKWVIAQATIKGSVYYNSYSNVGATGIGGQVLRIPPKGKAEPFLAFECNGCHSLSANGTRMTSQTLGLGARTYELASGQPQLKTAPVNNAYSAMYPDGSHYLVGSQVIDIGRSNIASPFSVANKATMFETDTGQTLPMMGIPSDVLMPSFSPDGSLLVFNDYAIASAHGLAALDYDANGKRGTNYRELVKTDGLRRPGWPFALPDNNGVVYVETESLDFSAYGAGVIAAGVTAVAAPFSDLMIVDLETGTSTNLARANGFSDAQGNDTYLPFGQEELHKNYFPTVSPVAAGGYFWVFWDSLRHYGNKGMSRQLWGTAIDIQHGGEITSGNGLYGDDHSHPAFYLPGQVFGTGNHRAFTALDPCKEDGASCESGVECCGGSCDTSNGTPGVCGKVTTCAKSDERCETKADCCSSTDSCIANYCAPVFL